MNVRRSMIVAAICLAAHGSAGSAPQAGPNIQKIADGIYVQRAREVNSNSGIIITSEGVVVVDTGQTPIDTHEVLDAVRSLTPLPVRFV
jgi:hypothetical protein